ncbi:MAG TPA: FAD-dependent oxidoreductase, partial [Steroidobacteraceae bacterium]|nr:FAD-dependent oxidoreductase [Steroidobacteraceae bacterium]
MGEGTPRGAGRCDALIIGGGHNGLVCAAYLAAAGLKVTVLERRALVGGAAVTEEFYPGFRNSVAAYTVSLLNPKVIRDLDLARHGLRLVERRAANFLPTADGRYLLTGEGRTQAEVARFSARDAARLPEYGERLEVIADVLRELALTTPPNALEGSWRAALPELLRAARVGGRLRRLDMSSRRELLALFAMSAGDYLDNWFESDPIKAVYGFDGIVGNYASPYTAGSAYVLLHHVFGEVNGKKGTWGHAIGGMGAITQAMRREAEARGVEIRTGRAVAKIVAREGRAAGAVLDDGTEVAVHPFVSCGACLQCRNGRPQLCRKTTPTMLGVFTDGGMADEVAVPESCVVRLPQSVSAADASIIEPLAVALHACNRARIEAGMRVGVVG